MLVTLTPTAPSASRAVALAITAWSEISPAHRFSRGNLLTSSDKSMVVRLEHDRSGESIIAKRAARVAVETEALVYAQLSAVGVLTPECFGTASDEDSAAAWLFTAEAHGMPYDLGNKEQAALAARWLASLHTSTRIDQSTQVDQLPRHDPAIYLSALHRARTVLRERAACRGDAEAGTVLGRCIDACDALERRWDHVVGLTQALPEALVHGDLSPENIYFVGERIYVFDWEKAGLGTTAVDVARVDVEAYCASMADYGPSNSEVVMRAAACGALFRTLSHNWSKKSIRKLDHYQRRLFREMRLAGLTGDMT